MSKGSVYKWNGYTFTNVANILGMKENAKYLFDCEIRDSKHNVLETVLIFANNFGEVKWCLMGYLGESLVMWDSEPQMQGVKQFRVPSNYSKAHLVNEFYVHVVRCD